MRTISKEQKLQKKLCKEMTKHLLAPDNHDYNTKVHNLKIHLDVVRRQKNNTQKKH